MRLSFLRWAPLAAALAGLAVGDASAQGHVTASAAPSYGYGASAAAAEERPRFDLRRSAPPDRGALNDEDEQEDAEEADDADLGVVTEVAEAGQGTRAPAEPAASQPAWGERRSMLAVRDDSLSGLAAAHSGLPIPSLVDVSNNGRFSLVRIERRSRDEGRLFLSPRAAEALGVAPGAEARVEVRYLGPAPSAVAANDPSGPLRLLPPDMETPEPWSVVPAREAQAAPAAPARASWAAPPPARYAAAGGGYMVQVGAFAELANAHRARAALVAHGEVSVAPRMVRGVELYRVRLGPWAERGQAERARRQVAALGFPDAIITPP
jgi:cell division septation protein DedD